MEKRDEDQLGSDTRLKENEIETDKGSKRQDLNNMDQTRNNVRTPEQPQRLDQVAHEHVNDEGPKKQEDREQEALENPEQLKNDDEAPEEQEDLEQPNHGDEAPEEQEDLEQPNHDDEAPEEQEDLEQPNHGDEAPEEQEDLEQENHGDEAPEQPEEEAHEQAQLQKKILVEYGSYNRHIFYATSEQDLHNQVQKHFWIWLPFVLNYKKGIDFDSIPQVARATVVTKDIRYIPLVIVLAVLFGAAYLAIIQPWHSVIPPVSPVNETFIKWSSRRWPTPPKHVHFEDNELVLKLDGPQRVHYPIFRNVSTDRAISVVIQVSDPPKNIDMATRSFSGAGVLFRYDNRTQMGYAALLNNKGKLILSRCIMEKIQLNGGYVYAGLTMEEETPTNNTMIVILDQKHLSTYNKLTVAPALTHCYEQIPDEFDIFVNDKYVTRFKGNDTSLSALSYTDIYFAGHQHGNWSLALAQVLEPASAWHYVWHLLSNNVSSIVQAIAKQYIK